ncbi:hypothetical protein NQZ68_019266 [Dissostichus eleginoides]|nr:hypothetical protein NQZ68_042054 [Dissostichus eleginoides]KAI9537930.1 hypothetical protein NQZ68_019266 [Dissostichus eleginoides]
MLPLSLLLSFHGSDVSNLQLNELTNGRPSPYRSYREAVELQSESPPPASEELHGGRYAVRRREKQCWNQTMRAAAE